MGNRNFEGFEIFSDVEVELMDDLMDKSSGNSCSCIDDWSDSTELVLGYLDPVKKTLSL